MPRTLGMIITYISEALSRIHGYAQGKKPLVKMAETKCNMSKKTENLFHLKIMPPVLDEYHVKP